MVAYFFGTQCIMWTKEDFDAIQFICTKQHILTIQTVTTLNFTCTCMRLQQTWTAIY